MVKASITVKNRLLNIVILNKISLPKNYCSLFVESCASTGVAGDSAAEFVVADVDLSKIEGCEKDLYVEIFSPSPYKRAWPSPIAFDTISSS